MAGADLRQNITIIGLLFQNYISSTKIWYHVMMIAYIPLDEQNSESNILSLVTWSVSGNNYVYLRIHKLNAQ